MLVKCWSSRGRLLVKFWATAGRSLLADGPRVPGGHLRTGRAGLGPILVKHGRARAHTDTRARAAGAGDGAPAVGGVPRMAMFDKCPTPRVFDQHQYPAGAQVMVHQPSAAYPRMALFDQYLTRI